MKKLLVTFLSIIVITLASVSPAYAFVSECEWGLTWIQNGSDWKMLYEDGTYATNRWKYYDGYFYHFNESGILDTNRYVGNYYVLSTGEMDNASKRANGLLLGNDNVWLDLSSDFVLKNCYDAMNLDNSRHSPYVNDTITDIMNRLGITSDTDKRTAINLFTNYLRNTYPYDYEGDADPEFNASVEVGLKNGKLICNGYATMIQLFCERIGVECKYCLGYVGFNGSYHAWNEYTIDGVTTHTSNGTDITKYIATGVGYKESLEKSDIFFQTNGAERTNYIYLFGYVN